MRTLFALALLGLAAGPLHAAPITEDINFSLSGFLDISGTAPPPIPLITGSITVTYDPTLKYDNDTTDIVVHSLTGITIGSPLGFTYEDGFLEFGGTQNDSDIVGSFTDDLVVAFNVTDPADPKFVPCSTPGYTCGKYTGNSLVEAAGYTRADVATGWFYGAPQSIVSPTPIPPVTPVTPITTSVPEPATVALLGAGLAALVVVKRVRPTRPR